MWCLHYCRVFLSIPSQLSADRLPEAQDCRFFSIPFPHIVTNNLSLLVSGESRAVFYLPLTLAQQSKSTWYLCITWGIIKDPAWPCMVRVFCTVSVQDPGCREVSCFSINGKWVLLPVSLWWVGRFHSPPPEALFLTHVSGQGQAGGGGIHCASFSRGHVLPLFRTGSRLTHKHVPSSSSRQLFSCMSTVSGARAGIMAAPEWQSLDTLY